MAKKKYVPLDSWCEYEKEKRKLQQFNLTAEEYEAELKELVERLDL